MDKEKLRTGSLQADWTDTASLLPVSEWAKEILGEAILESPLVSIIEKGGNLRRANKKQLYFKSKVTTGSARWAYGVNAVRDQDEETQMDLDTMFIDPIEWRTMTPVAWETLDEVDMIPIEAYVRKNLTHAASLKLSRIGYEAFNHNDLHIHGFGRITHDYDWTVAGNALTGIDTNTAIDWGDSFTADNFKSGVETLVAVGYHPDSLILPPAMYMDLFNESQFINAAQYGAQNTAILGGTIPRFMGIDTYIDLYMPDDSADKDVGVMIDSTKFMGMVVSKDPKIDVHTEYNTGEVEFFMNLKSSASVIQESAGVAYYT